ncbi:hypothetical protein SHIRM173S_09017 [Streptomyces hirsutus]
MRETEAIFDHAETERLIDFSQPACVLFNSVFTASRTATPTARSPWRAGSGNGSRRAASS